MGAERATFRLEPEALQPAVEFRVHRSKRFEAVVQANPQHARSAGEWKNARLTQDEVEWLDEKRHSECGEHLTDTLVGYVTDESDGHVHVLGRNPFPRRPAIKLPP